MNIIDRAKNILLQPKQEWQVIETERTPTPELYKGYILLLAAIGPLASIVGFSLIGMNVPFAGTVRIPLSTSITQAVVTYALTLASVYILALIINALAPTFAGVQDSNQALKVAAYSSTAAWLAGVFTIFPLLSVLGLLLAVYSFYLLYVGLPILMKSPTQKALGYTATVVVAAIVIFVGIGAVSGALIQYPVSVTQQQGAEQAAKQLEDLGKGLQDALKQGGEGSGDALKRMEKAVSSTKSVELVDFRQLKELLPDAVRGMQRNEATGERSSAFGINVSKAEGQYTVRDQGTITITISDMGSMTGLTGMAVYAWATADIDRETATGYEKTMTYRGYKAYEKYDKDSQSGEINVIVGGRFMVQVEGSDVKVEDLRTALDKVNLSKLAAMKS